jgi:CubicO group peptidase (beta-lactamase class C family)
MDDEKKSSGFMTPGINMEPVRHLMQQAVEEKVFPGGVLLVARAGSIVFLEAFGVTDLFTGEKTRIETVYDLASLTKPLATTLAVMHLIQNGRLTLESRIGEIIGEYKGTDKETIRIQNLLCHNAGLEDYLPFYRQIKGKRFDQRKKELRRLIVATPLKYPSEERVLYSDIGFMVLNQIIEAASGESLDRLVCENIYVPLGLDPAKDLFFVNLETGIPEGVPFAATEWCSWRGKLIKGEVHDENAYHVGGVEGHAGLFGTINAVHLLLETLMGIYHGNLESGLFSRDMAGLFLKEQQGTGRTLGFDMPDLESSSAGKYFSRNTVGHLGFTGTSFWMDLDRAAVVVLLTNRIHPVRDNLKIRSFRPVLHDRIMESLLSNG